MKKTFITLFSISVFAGTGYLVWAYSPLGKKALSRWLLKKWAQQAKRKNKVLNLEKLRSELEKLDYSHHELLAQYTLLNPMEKQEKGKLTGRYKQRFERYYKKMNEQGLFKRADLSSLENIVLPG